MACRESWPLLEDLPTLSVPELEERGDWTVARAQLEAEIGGWDVATIQALCHNLGRYRP